MKKELVSIIAPLKFTYGKPRDVVDQDCDAVGYVMSVYSSERIADLQLKNTQTEPEFLFTPGSCRGWTIKHYTEFMTEARHQFLVLLGKIKLNVCSEGDNCE